jgi:hypothetical protein
MGKEGKYDLRLADPPVITETDTETETEEEDGVACHTNASDSWPTEANTPGKLKKSYSEKFIF